MFEITKEFKTDIKKADCITVHFNKKECILSLITKEKQNNNGWIKPEQRKTYKAEVSSWNSHKKAYFYIGYKESSNFQAIEHIARAGDKLSLFAEENNNQYLEEVNLFHDELIARIYRKDKVVIQRLMLCWSCCPDNSARAIKKIA